MKSSEALAPSADTQVPQPYHAESRPWGSWTVLAEGHGYRIKMIDMQPSHRMSLHYHHNRSEHWVVVAGKARIVIGEKHYDMQLMQSVLIPARTVHRIENPYSELLQIVEVQRGDQLDEDDIVRLEDDYQSMHSAHKTTRGSVL